MDWLEFASRSEWPLVATGTIAFLRKQLRALISQISPTKLDAWGLKAEFERKLEKVELLSNIHKEPSQEEVPLERNNTTPVAEGHNARRDDTEHHLARYRASPETAIIAGWNRVERGILNNASSAGLDVQSRKLDEPLLRQIGMSRDKIEIFRDLRSLRNAIACADGPTAVTWEEATRFVEAIFNLHDFAKKAVNKRQMSKNVQQN